MPDSIDLVGVARAMSEPFAELVKRIDDSLRRSREPQLIERTARAEVAAAMIHARGAIEVDELRRRAGDRFVAEQLTEQQNIDVVVGGAKPFLNPEISAFDMSDDWIRRLLESAKYTTEEHARLLLSRMLAGEANKAGSFAKRTITILSSMEAEELELLRKVISAGHVLGGQSRYLPLIYGGPDDVYVSSGITLTGLTELDGLGLIAYDGFMGAQRTQQDSRVNIAYFDEYLQIDLASVQSGPAFLFPIGSVRLTRAGEEIASLLEPFEIPGFLDYLAERFTKDGYTVDRLSMDSLV